MTEELELRKEQFLLLL